MSVDDIQKVNKLAQDLLDQGICTERQQAVQQAEQMLNKNLTKASQTPELNNEQMDEFKNFMMRSKDYMEKQLKVFRQDIQSLANQIEELKKQIRTAPPPIIKEKCETPQTELETKPHPRSGNTEAKDVSIEKMFYYGNK